MKKFRFPLRPVGVLRVHRQTRARETFAASVHCYVQSEEHLAILQHQRQQLETVLHDGRRTVFHAAEQISFWGAYRRVTEDEIQAERAVIAARAKMEEHRQEYMEAHRAVKRVEKLEQKAHTVYRLLSEREDQRELDELAVLRRALPMEAGAAMLS
ncbi:MAG: flagellar export protein FliJ [Opitutae bacterium]